VPVPHTAADILVETLIEAGVDMIFGLPGDGINGIMDSLRRRQAQVRFTQARHEEAAGQRPLRWSRTSRCPSARASGR
jgi:thiamine pyrophosphate-dependent acetolactate synthase large subunit-like protein